MQAMRQLGVGVIVAIVSVILVLGGVFLSLAENLPTAATPTQIPPTFPQSFPTPTATPETPTELPTLTVTQTQLVTETASPTLALVSPTSCAPPPGWIRVTSSAGDTVYALAQRYRTTPETLSAANCLTTADVPAGMALYVPPVPTVTVIPCGPPPGWVRNYIVQRGDTLFSIALSYNITYPQLQRANCMGGSTTIYAGQRLWVPNLPTRTPVPGVTFVPDTPTASATPLPPTPLPTDTATQPPTATIAPSDTPPPTVTPITPAVSQ